MKTAFITGITGQDGSYLAEFLLQKGYKVVGLVSKKHGIGEENIKHIKKKLILEKGDLLDKLSLERIFTVYKPDEVYNLGGLTFIPKCWENPVLTFDVNALGVLRLLEIIKGNFPKTKFYQASSAKMFGSPKESPQDEETEINPQDPYSVSKACAHFLTRAFRKNYSLFVVSGIMYNHESPRRGPEFVTRKIALGAARISLGMSKKLKLGNLEAKRDWGWAPDYIKAMWLMLQQKNGDDYVIATGQLHSVRDVCQVAFSTLGLDYKKYVVHDKILFRKQEGKKLCGDASKARRLLGWKPKVRFEEMIRMMVREDLRQLKSDLFTPGVKKAK